MRRVTYPYGRYIIRDLRAVTIGEKMKEFLEKQGFPITRFDPKNEGNGILIVAVNKRIKDFIREKRPVTHVELLLKGLFTHAITLEKKALESQRVGIEVYLWPLEENDTLLELFIFPYMEFINKKEIYGLTESREEELRDWCLCEQVWEELAPKLEIEFDAEPLHHRP